MQPSNEIIKLSKDILMGVGYTRPSKEGRKRRFRDENEAEEEKDDLNLRSNESGQKNSSKS